MDILKIIFVVFLGTFSLGEVIRFNLGNNIFIKPVDIVLAILLITWIAYNFKIFIKILRSEVLFIPIMWVIIIMLISLAVNFKRFSGNEILAGISYIARWVIYAFLFFIVKNFPKKFKDKILYLLMVVGGLFILFGFIQYFFYSSLRNLYYLNWDEHMYRMFSAFLDPNFAGAFFVLFLIFLLTLLMHAIKSRKTKEIWIIGSASIIALFSIFMTYSRSALIMLFVSVLVFLLLTKKSRWIIILGLTTAIFFLISSKNFNIENINLFRAASSEARLESARAALKIIKNNPVFGVGFNTYRYAQIKYGYKNPANAAVSHADAGTDNSFLFILGTVGIIGSVFYANLLWAILRKCYKISLNSENDIGKYIAVAVIASIFGIMINSFFINSLFYSFILMWMWIILGLTENT